MARRYVGAALLLSVVSFVPLVSAQSESTSPREIWPQATAAVDTGDFETADKKLEELLEIGKLLGIRRFPLSAESAAALARQANKEGNREIAQWSINAGNKLDPVSPTVAFQAADLASDQAQWAALPQKLIGGFGRTMKDYHAMVLARADFTMALTVALIASALGIALILFTRYARSAAHDFREWIGTWFRAGVTTVIAFALLFLPLFLWLGPVWIALYWFVLVFSYATIREKLLVVMMLIVLAAAPVVLDWNSARVAGISSPIMRAAVASSEKMYHPESLRRLRELSQLLPDEPKIHLLLGNLELQQGNESQALAHYNKAKELAPDLAGAYINIGNYQFLNGEFQAAINEYQKATEIDKTIAIAPYNHSVAYGELYKYQEQGEKLEEAKERDRSMIEKVLQNPPHQKILMYDLPLDEAWELEQRIARTGSAREIFGNYATFDPVMSVQNSLTLGSLLALILSITVWLKRRRVGFANACIKCGRTFCTRCKSARDSATYCTQCIHIYLKRDGVSIDTKRLKMNEVQSYQSRALRMKKLLASFLPGSAQILDGSTIKGVIALVLFLLFVAIAAFTGRLAPIATPAEMMKLALRSLAILLAVIVWIMVSIPAYRQRVVV